MEADGGAAMLTTVARSANRAAQGDENAVKNRDTAAGLMTPDQLAEAQRLARKWKAEP